MSGIKKNSFKTSWLVFVSVIVLALMIYGGYILFRNYSFRNYDNNVIAPPSSIIKDDCSTCNQDLNDSEEAQSILDQFQSFQSDREAENVLSLMTEPETVNEENDLAALDSTPDFGPADRLYSANELTFKLMNYQVTSSEKIDDNEYWFYVTETRKLWSQESGGWSKKSYQYKRRFEIEKIVDDWMIDIYAASESEGKYSGFSTVNEI